MTANEKKCKAVDFVLTPEIATEVNEQKSGNVHDLLKLLILFFALLINFISCCDIFECILSIILAISCVKILLKK